MRTLFLYVILLAYEVFGQNHGTLSRFKRGTAGALDIITNNAQPIHADVRHEYRGTQIKPCPNTYVGNTPSNIESGVVFQVIPPKSTTYSDRSLRKSLPLDTKLDLVRAASRVVTLITLLFSAAVEFYPLVLHLYNTIYEFIYFNKY